LLYPNVGSLWLAGIVQTALAASEIRLYQTGSVTLSALTVLADLTAAEADYTGYAAEAVATWFDPLLNPLGGASIESGLVQFQIDAPYTVSNEIQGWWVETAGGTLVCAGDFAVAKSLVGAGDGIPFNVELIFGGTS
jgi:hypothetical protein